MSKNDVKILDHYTLVYLATSTSKFKAWDFVVCPGRVSYESGKLPLNYLMVQKFSPWQAIQAMRCLSWIYFLL